MELCSLVAGDGEELSTIEAEGQILERDSRIEEGAIDWMMAGQEEKTDVLEL
jgi:hypothetical protein